MYRKGQYKQALLEEAEGFPLPLAHLSPHVCTNTLSPLAAAAHAGGSQLWGTVFPRGSSQTLSWRGTTQSLWISPQNAIPATPRVCYRSVFFYYWCVQGHSLQPVGDHKKIPLLGWSQGWCGHLGHCWGLRRAPGQPGYFARMLINNQLSQEPGDSHHSNPKSHRLAQPGV